MTPLNQIVSIRRRFLRSVNIARDQKRPQGLDGYILTPLIIVLYVVALFATRKNSENIEDIEQGATNKF